VTVRSVHCEPSEDTLVGLNRLATTARLMSGAVHDVNNALMIISGTVELLESRADVPASMKESLGRLRSQSARAAGALTQVLQFTRAARTVRQPVNLRELVEESLALRDYAIRRARLTHRFEADGTTTFVVDGNRGDLQQVVLNLIINAEQALAGSTGTIVVRLSIEDRQAVVRVLDEGSGITMAPADRVFDPFTTTYSPFDSAGLGLWAARLLVEQHGGVLTTQPGSSGAVFEMKLPRVELRR
jgi:signal transduction histidine kinase